MEKQEPKKPNIGNTLMIVAALFLIIAAAQLILTNNLDSMSQGLRMAETDVRLSYEFDAEASFYSNGDDYFYFCTKDGMRYVSSAGDVDWQEPFTFTRPLISARGDMVAVAEAKGLLLYLFDNTGLKHDLSFDKPLLYFSVNSTGYLTAILQLDKGYEIHVYSPLSTEPIYQYALHDVLVQPTMAEVSSDGRILAVSMLDYNLRLEARVAFYYTNQQEARAYKSDYGFFAGNDYPDEIILNIKFMDDNKALVFTDTQIICYQPGEANELTELWRTELHNRIDQLAFYEGSRFAYVTGDGLLNDEQAQAPGTLNIFSLDGLLTGVFEAGRKATYLSMGHDAAIVGADRNFNAITANGGRLWEYISFQDTQQLIFLENTNTVLMSGGDRAAVLKRGRINASETEEDTGALDAPALIAAPSPTPTLQPPVPPVHLEDEEDMP